MLTSLIDFLNLLNIYILLAFDLRVYKLKQMMTFITNSTERILIHSQYNI